MKKRCERHDCRKKKQDGSKWCPLHTAEIEEAQASARVREMRILVVARARSWHASAKPRDDARLAEAVELLEAAMRDLYRAEHCLHALKGDGTRASL